MNLFKALLDLFKLSSAELKEVERAAITLRPGPPMQVLKSISFTGNCYYILLSHNFEANASVKVKVTLGFYVKCRSSGLFLQFFSFKIPTRSESFSLILLYFLNGTWVFMTVGK